MMCVEARSDRRRSLSGRGCVKTLKRGRATKIFPTAVLRRKRIRDRSFQFEMKLRRTPHFPKLKIVFTQPRPFASIFGYSVTGRSRLDNGRSSRTAVASTTARGGTSKLNKTDLINASGAMLFDSVALQDSALRNSHNSLNGVDGFSPPDWKVILESGNSGALC